MGVPELASGETSGLGEIVTENQNKKWTEEEVVSHIKANADYSSAVVMAALFKKIYGYFPKIGLSGFQGSGAEIVYNYLPDPKEVRGSDGR